jgi:hypothetical protein
MSRHKQQREHTAKSLRKEARAALLEIFRDAEERADKRISDLASLEILRRAEAGIES